MCSDIGLELILFTNTKMRCNLNPSCPARWGPGAAGVLVNGPMVSGYCLREPYSRYVICQTNRTIYERGMSL